MDAETLKSLHLLSRQIKAGDQSGQLDTLQRLGLARLFEFKPIALTLGVGDIELVAYIAALTGEYSPEPARCLEILQACETAQKPRTSAEKTALLTQSLELRQPQLEACPQ
jgi:hypothetical protein